jgi:rhodanese-related sulfurtransferase
MFEIFKKLFSREQPVDHKELLGKGAILLDVRTPEEYKAGHIKSAINVPVDQVRSRIAEIKAMNKPVITYCRSGMRSRTAMNILKGAGIECYNGGGWDALQVELS